MYKFGKRSRKRLKGVDSRLVNVLNELINEFDSTSPKAFYLRGLILIGLDDQKEQACLDLKYANDKGLISNTRIYDLACLSN